MISKVLVMCIGNICRSPMALAMLRQQVSARIQLRSAGLAACIGQDIDPKSAQVLAEHGVEHEPHTARQLEDDMLRWADLILVMDRRQLSSVRLRAPQVQGKTFLIGQWCSGLEIGDPFGRPLNAFQHTYACLAMCIDSWSPYLSFEDQDK